MSFCENWASPFLNSLWSESTETWHESQEDWRIVGTNPFKRRSENACKIERKLVEFPMKQIFDSIETSFKFMSIAAESHYYIIQFESKRLDVAFVDVNLGIRKNSYVILEADRGEDCGMVVGVTTKEKLERLFKKYEDISNEVQPKRIYRLATLLDLEALERKRSMQTRALEFCRERAFMSGLDMEVVGCEYQWDLNKITFYFASDERVDFRDLVKELYRVYKTRIWMCAIEKSKNRHLNELIESHVF
ncbi:Psp1-like protein [Ordospora colligata]|uniref:Psp1-like protein n=1 Tax=Ordospora colligata OC4 TaxID=1354746 RepID=A0A0B2ULL1_9MICR|nr:Psp1-like protein [Ordospora colligata OC4]XP_014564206.1 Psp1-like protein [Ordospora colligata OC4]TBU16402.1 Psp1-like protein [Ordospora colligata]KHN70020.1 Psp1-like protein [Ordospora colligata OC4]KHN70164.1 Psp1-like protein [Ordospora colligata OC4]TBU16587.1 Psp1-like protein [Ordospora colligata]TBU19160.1 Psp1-like protein [Ordospora colligata]